MATDDKGLDAAFTIGDVSSLSDERLIKLCDTVDRELARRIASADALKAATTKKRAPRKAKVAS
jgi:hypothetical protein